MDRSVKYSIWARENSLAPWAKITDCKSTRKPRAMKQMDKVREPFASTVEFELREETR